MSGRVIGDAGEHVGNVELRVEAIELGGFNQRVHRRGAPAAGVGAGEQIVLLDALAALSTETDGLGVGPRVRLLLGDMLDQWRDLDRRIAALDDEFAGMARKDPAARRLATIPGVGVLNATALVAAIGDGAPSAVAAISRPGWGWRRARRPLVALRDCLGSPSAAANICGPL
jgi:transposase